MREVFSDSAPDMFVLDSLTPKYQVRSFIAGLLITLCMIIAVAFTPIYEHEHPVVASHIAIQKAAPTTLHVVRLPVRNHAPIALHTSQPVIKQNMARVQINVAPKIVAVATPAISVTPKAAIVRPATPAPHAIIAVPKASLSPVPHVVSHVNLVPVIAALPRILSVSLSQQNIALGASAILCAKTVHANSVTISEIGTVKANTTACVSVSPTVTTTYIIEAIGASGDSIDRYVTLTVGNPDSTQ